MKAIEPKQNAESGYYLIFNYLYVGTTKVPLNGFGLGFINYY